jgi:hypothetical protein
VQERAGKVKSGQKGAIERDSEGPERNPQQIKQGKHSNSKIGQHLTGFIQLRLSATHGDMNLLGRAISRKYICISLVAFAARVVVLHV